MSRALPFLTFQPGRGQSAAAAMSGYTGIFGDGATVSDVRHGPDGPGPEGSVQVAEFVVAEQHVRCSDSFVDHAWDFTPALSLWVELDDAEDLRRVAEALAEGGTVHMPLDDYGFGPFTWLDDRYGVSWQLGAPVP